MSNDPRDISEGLTLPLHSAPGGSTTIKNRYAIEKELGRGGFGVVYLARDLQLHNRPVVIKVLREVLEEDWHAKKFKQEIEALVRLEHPGIVGVFDSGEMPGGQLFVVMQFVEGVNLRSIIKSQNGPMEFDRVAQIMEQAGRALSAAHDKGVLHCDVKPDNIMIQQIQPGEDIVKLIDFGIAKIRDSQITSAAPTRVAGTIDYMAPEQLEGAPIAASDIFALGAIAYEMLTGRKVFAAQNFIQIYHLHREGVKVLPKDLRPDLPDAAQAAIVKALAFDPAARYTRAREFTDDLARALRGATAATAPALETKPSTKEVSGSAETQLLDSLPFEPAPQNAAEPLQSQRAVMTAAPAKKNHAQWIALLAVILLAAIAGAVWWSTRQPSFSISRAPIIQKRAAGREQKVVAPARELVLSYSILVQKFRDGKPYEDPFQPTRDIIFEHDYKIQVHLKASKTGQLYIINEGPKSANGLPEFNALYDAQIPMNGDVSVPRDKWFQFDRERGTEKLWLIYSLAKIPEFAQLDELRGPEIKDAKTIQTIADFLKKTQVAANERKDELTILKARGDTLVHLLKLDHF